MPIKKWSTLSSEEEGGVNMSGIKPSAVENRAEKPGTHVIKDGTSRRTGNIMDGTVYPNPYLGILADKVSECTNVEGQIKKIRTLLQLVELTPKDDIDSRKYYFYEAVRIAQRYIGDDFFKQEIGKEFIDSYIINIDSTHEVDFEKILLLNYVNKIKRLRQLAEMRLKGPLEIHPLMVLKNIESAIGPFRLIVVSKDNGEILSVHNVDLVGAMQIIDEGKNVKETVTSPFHKARSYDTYIDFGSPEDTNIPTDEELYFGLQNAIDFYIECSEIHSSQKANADSSEIELLESQNISSPRGLDYRSFLRSITSDKTDIEIFYLCAENPNFVEDCEQAIHITKMVLDFTNKDIPFPGDLLSIVKKTLNGKIKRKVLTMVKSMLLSHRETMNGAGYPFGISKPYIAIEGRIFALVRVYEALSSKYSSEEIKERMQGLADSGYLDKKLVDDFLRLKPTPYQQFAKKIDPLTDIQRRRYLQYIEEWKEVINLTESIKGKTKYLRSIQEGDNRDENDVTSVRSLVYSIEKMREQLLKYTGRKKIYIMRHGETDSDKMGGTPGHPKEPLNGNGKASSRKNGGKFQYMSLDKYSSPLTRAVESMEYVSGQVESCITPRLATQSDAIKIIKPLENLSKDKLDGSTRNAVDIAATEREAFLFNLLASASDRQIVLMTHRKIAESLAILIGLRFSGSSSILSPKIVDNDYIGQFTIIGGETISGEKESSRGFLFQYNNWENILSVINDIAGKTFGKNRMFYKRTDAELINLVDLHDKFLDFLDYWQGKSPKRFNVFLIRLYENESTNHFRPIIENLFQCEI